MAEDKDLIPEIIEKALEFVSEQENLEGVKDKVFVHPLHNQIIEELKVLDGFIQKDVSLYANAESIKNIWGMLLESSVKCLRFFDRREPYYENADKQPEAYGLKEIKEYFDEFSRFESLLYGSGEFYRDHVIHVFRTWLLGIDLLLWKNDGHYMVDGVSKNISDIDSITFNNFETISIWTIAVLCHDLGYPLSKSHDILSKTNSMMSYFIHRPSIDYDYSFNSTQDHINNYIVRLMSSKMKLYQASTAASDSDSKYTGRLQPKYYMKFNKSLEQYSHGIVSAIILYKTLVYFLESDYSIEEDYSFYKEDVRQFYARREVLRAMAAHTCDEIYHMKVANISFILRLADDLQEWDRRRFIDFYREKSDSKDDCKVESFSEDKIHIVETVYIDKVAFKKSIIWAYERCEAYKKILRDGNDTVNRDFDYSKEHVFHIGTMTFTLNYNVPKNSKAEYTLESNDKGKDFLDEVVKNKTFDEFGISIK